MSKPLVLALLVAAGSFVSREAVAQRPVELAFADPQPHFVAAWAPKKAREAERSAVLARRLSLELADVTLDAALKALTNRAGLHITYSPAILPEGRRVTISAGDIAVVTALTEILFRSGLDVVVDRDGTLALVPCRHPAPRHEVQDSGTIVGTVSDRATRAPIPGATVAVEGTRLSATTGTDGRYRIGGVEPGMRSVRARYIGYAPLVASVTVAAGGEVTADFGLEKSTQKLDELVTVTPGGMQTSVKALPTPVTVITAEDIQALHAQTLAHVFRQATPSGVSFTLPAQPGFTALSARGASSLGGGAGMKVFVDGIETSAASTSPVDPESVERIEVIRGPQASTVYGADAAGGVVQITTKRGSNTPAEFALRAEGGLLQTPYPGARSAFRQAYDVAVRGGGPVASFNFGAGFWRLANWLPAGEISRQSVPSFYGGMRYAKGIITSDLTARFLQTNSSSVGNPALQTTGQFFSRPFFTPLTYTNQTYGVRVAVAPTSWWLTQLTVGADRFRRDETQSQRRLTTPEDTLYSISDVNSEKVSVFLNTSVTHTFGANVRSTLVIGVDRFNNTIKSFSTGQAINTIGTIQTIPAGALIDSRATVRNTGYFVQGETNWREALFLTAGLRADDNSTFGADLSTPFSPRIGLSAVQGIGKTIVKLRGAYGRAIRGASPGAALGSGNAFSVTLPNPLLRPERSGGWDGGFDLIFGNHGSLSVTGFSQSGEDLISLVSVIGSAVLPTFQWQNVGKVSNRGLELDGKLYLGIATLRGQYSYVRSRVRELGPGIQTGSQIQVGDRPLSLPAHTAGGSLATTPWVGTTLTAAFTYVGGYRDTDLLALFACFGGTGTCAPDSRGYVIEYPGFVKFSLSASQAISRQVEATLSVENLTNNFAFEGVNTQVVMGRTTLVGLRARL